MDGKSAIGLSHIAKATKSRDEIYLAIEYRYRNRNRNRKKRLCQRQQGSNNSTSYIVEYYSDLPIRYAIVKHLAEEQRTSLKTTTAFLFGNKQQDEDCSIGHPVIASDPRWGEAQCKEKRRSDNENIYDGGIRLQA
jgi:hypothetical protein